MNHVRGEARNFCFSRELFKKICNRETIYYLFFGILTTVINIFVYELCTSLTIPYWVSNIIAWIMSVVFAFITNKLFVFNSQTRDLGAILKEALSFIIARLFSGVCDLAFMVIAVSYIHMDDFIAKLITNVFVVIMNYFFSKLFIFKKNNEN